MQFYHFFKRMTKFVNIFFNNVIKSTWLIKQNVKIEKIYYLNI